MLRLRGLSLRGELAASFPPNLAYAVICFREFPEVRLYPPSHPPKHTPAARPPRINMRQVPPPHTPPYPSLPLPTPLSTQVRFEVDADVSMGTVPFADPDPSPSSSPSPGPNPIPTLPRPDGLRAYCA